MRRLAGRRAEDHDLDRRVRRSRALCRPGRHHDDVFGHRRAGPQRDLAPDPGERRAGDGRDGQGAARRDARGARRRAARPELPAIGLTMFGVTTPCVQQLTAALSGEYDCLVFHATGVGGQSMEKLVDGGQLEGVIDITTTEVCDLHDGRRVSGDRGPLRRDHPRAHPLCGLGRRARHGELRAARHRAGALSGPAAASAQSAGHADAHHAGRERADGPLDRRAAEPDGCAGALPAARRRRVGAR